MSQAVYSHDDPMRMSHWFECPGCGEFTEVSSYVWEHVEVLGAKPTLDCCELRPHIPPSPRGVEAFRGTWDAVAGGDKKRP